MKTAKAKGTKKKEALHPLLRKKINHAKVLRMLKRWAEEDSKKDPKKAEAEWREFQKNIEANRLSNRPRFDH